MTARAPPADAVRPARGGLFVGLDFDGTLAPIADDPDAPVAGPAIRRTVARFVADPGTTVAVVSGRAVDDLRPRVGIEGAIYAGNHGLELDWGGRTVRHPAAVRSRPALDRALDRIRDLVADVPGAEIEDKGATATIHVRGAPADRVDDVRAAVAAAVDPEPSLVTNPGKEVFEIRPAVEWDKGTAVELLSNGVADDATVYVGDDVTDEDAFRVVAPDGVAVLVGDRQDSLATHRLPNQAAVEPFLDRVADATLDRRRLPKP